MAEDPNQASSIDESIVILTDQESVEELNSISILTGYGAGCHYIIPGTFFPTISTLPTYQER